MTQPSSEGKAPDQEKRQEIRETAAIISVPVHQVTAEEKEKRAIESEERMNKMKAEALAQLRRKYNEKLKDVREK